MIRAFFRIPAFFFVVTFYSISSLLIELLIKDPFRRLSCLSGFTSKCSRVTLWILGVKVVVKNMPTDPNAFKQVLAAANHVSYLDIIVISSVFPSLYITSVEVQRAFFIGFLSRIAGSLFVERRSKTKLLQEIDRIAGVLKQGLTITLFPEGTSSNGEKVLPFKGALFSTAEKAGVPILPLCIKYSSINGKPVSPENRDLVFYYGDHEFFPHLFKLFSVKNIKVSVTYLAPVQIDQIERKDLVDHVFTAISQQFSSC